MKRPAAAKTKVDKDKKEKAHGSGIKRPAAKRDVSQDKNKKKKPALFQPLHAAKKKDAKEAKEVSKEKKKRTLRTMRRLSSKWRQLTLRQTDVRNKNL